MNRNNIKHQVEDVEQSLEPCLLYIIIALSINLIELRTPLLFLSVVRSIGVSEQGRLMI